MESTDYHYYAPAMHYGNNNSCAGAIIGETSVMLFDVRKSINKLATIGDPMYPMQSNSEQAIAQNQWLLTQLLGNMPDIVARPNVIAMEESYLQGMADAMVLPIAHQDTPRFSYHYTQVGIMVATVESIILIGTVEEEKKLLDGVHLMSRNHAHNNMVDNLIANDGFRINRRITEGIGNTVTVLDSLVKAGRNGANQAGITTRRGLDYFKAMGYSLYEWRELKESFNLVWVIYQ